MHFLLTPVASTDDLSKLAEGIRVLRPGSLSLITRMITLPICIRKKSVVISRRFLLQQPRSLLGRPGSQASGGMRISVPGFRRNTRRAEHRTCSANRIAAGRSHRLATAAKGLLGGKHAAAVRTISGAKTPRPATGARGRSGVGLGPWNTSLRRVRAPVLSKQVEEDLTVIAFFGAATQCQQIR